jgi:hypothetical protein
MPHIHWVERQNKLEIPKEKDEVNKREVHECDVRVRDPDAKPKANPRKFFFLRILCQVSIVVPQREKFFSGEDGNE